MQNRPTETVNKPACCNIEDELKFQTLACESDQLEIERRV